ncbi:MAG TPA: MerR family transcriptional regulator [Candidatus Dormibacteraeota bacterium]|nr:MerR family transcriptional regulator [Candidatus Dormibacteraeota bacterium]
MAMRIGELARRAGLAPSALRYYEQAGLLPRAERSEAGYRLYSERALWRLGFIRRAQALGLSVREIRRLIESPLADNGAQRAALRRVVAHKVAEVERRRQALTDLQADLEALYVRLLRAPGPDCGHVGDCACWLPTEEEVTTMATDVQAATDCGCTDCGCTDCGCCDDCGCCSTG